MSNKFPLPLENKIRLSSLYNSKLILGFVNAKNEINDLILDDSFLYESMNFNLAGVLKNKSMTSIEVPFCIPFIVTGPKVPDITSVCHPLISLFCLV